MAEKDQEIEETTGDETSEETSEETSQETAELEESSEETSEEEGSEETTEEEASDESSEEEEASSEDSEEEDVEEEASSEEEADEDASEDADVEEEASSEDESSEEDDAEEASDETLEEDSEEDAAGEDDAAEDSEEELAASAEEEDEELAYDDEDDVEDDYEVPANIDGLAAYFDYPEELLVAAAHMRDAEEPWVKWDAYSPFPIHGIEDAMGIGRSWMPWVTFGAGGTGFLLANLLQFGTLTFDWPMVIGGKPHAPWPSFVPIMFELTVLIGGVTTAFVMLVASGCFRKPKIIDREITNDRFLIWIAADDPNFAHAREFLQGLDPVEIREITYE